jgi:hypothetical protein
MLSGEWLRMAAKFLKSGHVEKLRISQAAIDECDQLFSVHANAMKELVRYHHELFRRVSNKDRLWQTLSVLINYQFDRSQAAYCLFVNGFVWDAEIIIRAVYETMAKIVYIGSCKEDDKDRLIDEYWNVLPAIFDMKGAQKAEAAKKLASRYGTAEDIRVFELLQNPEVFDLKPSVDQKARKEVEHRWSFSQIIKTLSSDGGGRQRVPGIDALAHMYGMSSHLIHASPKAIDLMIDRATREDDLHCLEVSHVCRMMSDIVSVACFSLQFSQFALEGKLEMAEPIKAQFNLMNESVKPFRDRFARSQDEFYSKYSGEA